MKHRFNRVESIGSKGGGVSDVSHSMVADDGEEEYVVVLSGTQLRRIDKDGGNRVV